MASSTNSKIVEIGATCPKTFCLTPRCAAVYLDGLSEGSVPIMKGVLNAIASLLTNGECDAIALDWLKLRYQHTAAMRTALKKRYTPTTVNKMLCVLRRVLKEAHRLDLIGADDYNKAVDLPSIREQKKLLVLGEIRISLINLWLCTWKEPAQKLDG